ncbi:RHS repeat-associated core domain-containing protein [Nocardia asteroides]|uniref:RHS repeat-associated core domain-containing protein n=1 Tax=Nocardia asteroides TaxID=1824 RepID=UPI00341C0FC4
MFPHPAGPFELHYNLHRIYDPNTGRFLTQDPLGREPAPNPSTYPFNPTAISDPLGLSPYNRTIENRSEAFNAALDRADVLRSQQPVHQLTVGDDPGPQS